MRDLPLVLMTVVNSVFTPWGPVPHLTLSAKVLGVTSHSVVLIIKVGLLRDSWMTLKPVGRKVGPLMNFQLVLLSTLPFSPNLHRPLRGNLKTSAVQ